MASDPGPSPRALSVAQAAAALLAETPADLAALATLQARGLLDAPDGFRGTLADALDRLVRGPLALGLQAEPGRARLLGELVANLADPGRINQGLKGTCAVTCIEVHAAERHPAEYARLVAGLCTPAGAVGLRNGEALCRDEQVLAPHAAEGRRSPVSRLFQVAAMELGYPGLDYRNLEDGHFELSGEGPVGTGDQGLGLGAFNALLEGITGQDWALLTDRNDDLARLLGWDPDAVLDLERDGPGIMERSLAAGEVLFATLAPPDAPRPAAAAAHPLLALPHKVRVLALHDGRVVYDDPLDPDRPWIPHAATRVLDRAGRCSMALSDFQAMVVELSYMPRFAPPGRRAG